MNKYNSKIAKFLAWINNEKTYAITLGQTTFYSTPENKVSDRWRKHENYHKKQWKRDGLLKFSFHYIWYSVKFGYHNNPYEIEARKAEHE